MKIPSSEHGENMLCTEIVFDIQNNFCIQLVSQCSAKRRASDKDLPVLSRAIKIVKWKKQLVRKVNSRLNGHEKIKMVSFSLIIMLGTVLTFNKLMT